MKILSTQLEEKEIYNFFRIVEKKRAKNIC